MECLCTSCLTARSGYDDKKARAVTIEMKFNADSSDMSWLTQVKDRKLRNAGFRRRSRRGGSANTPVGIRKLPPRGSIED